MGQSVSADREPLDLKSLFQLGQDAQLHTSAGSKTVSSLADGVRHHLKAWKFEKQNRIVVDSPAMLCDAQGQFDVDLQKSSSYLILHIHAPSVSGAEGITHGGDDVSSETAALLEELAGSASASCSPRGLAIEVVSQSEASGCEGKPQLRYEIYVWHGLSVDPHVKARVFTKAFELDRLLRDGLLRHPALQSALQKGMTLRGPSRHAAGKDDVHSDGVEMVEKVRRSGNRLLTAFLDGTSKAAKIVNDAISGSRGAQRFPRLGLSVCRSLGVTPASAGCQNGQRMQPFAASPPGAVTVPAGSKTGSPPSMGMPKLMGLENLAKRDVGAPTKTYMDVDRSDGDHLDAGGRKRPRPPLRSTTNSVTPTATTVPKSARTDFNLPLQSPRAPRGTDGDDQALRHGNSGSPGNMPMLDLDGSQARQQNSMRADAPTMLNLEEINMSEEELIRSYDPDNEENNYHLPHHLHKKIQLDRFRPVCSEIIKNELFISSLQVPADINHLRRHGITHIVNTAADTCVNHFTGQIQYLTYYLKDANTEEMSLLFYRTLSWIDDAIKKGGRVLVHCREGVSRSSTMIIAYLMWRFSISFETAHDRIRRVRPICNPNTGFTCQLLVLGKRLGVAGGNAQAPSTDRPIVFRVGPYHPMEPFLLLFPTEWQWPSCPNFDPRFGWVVQRGVEVVLWLGAQVVDAEATKEAVNQHYAWILTFERIETRITVVQDGLEPVQFWQVMGLSTPPPDRGKFTAIRPSFDTDADILARAHGGADPPTQAMADMEELEVSIESITSSEAATDSSTPMGESVGRPPATGPPKPVPALSLGGLGGLQGLVGPPVEEPQSAQ